MLLFTVIYYYDYCYIHLRCRVCLAAGASPSHQVYRDTRAPLPVSQRRALIALNLKLESSQDPGNTGSSPSPPGAYHSTVPTKLRVCVGQPRLATVIIHTEYVEGGLITSCYYLRVKGKCDMLHDLLKGAVLFAWEIRFVVRIYRVSLL